ncbi:hypothetical protein GOV12_06035 [Candidatus Pacearchaeota archaeon]|nr:hypothetical protein [Candidatus Pacearchaeota archaeon]
MVSSLEKLLRNGIGFSYDLEEDTHVFEIDTNYCCEFIGDSEKMMEYVKRCSDIIADVSRDEDVYNDFEISLKGENVVEYIGVLEGLTDKSDYEKKKVEGITEKVGGSIYVSLMIGGVIIGGIVGAINPKFNFQLSAVTGGVLGVFLGGPTEALSDIFTPGILNLYYSFNRKRRHYYKILNCIDEEGMDVYSELVDLMEHEDDEN